jgi:membrane protein required for colicin V production
MNWLDIVIVVLLAGSMIGSFWRGFTRDLAGFGATLAALVLGTWFYGMAGAVFLPYTSSRGIANFLGFVTIFFSVLLIGALVGLLLSRIVHGTGLTFPDRLLGAAFGLVRGVLFSIALVLILMAFTPGSTSGAPPRAIVQSRLAPYVVEAANVVSAVAPYELKQGFRRSYAKVKDIWKSTIDKGVRQLPMQEL